MISKIFSWAILAQCLLVISPSQQKLNTIKIESKKQPIQGKSFVIVGDYGDMWNDLKFANQVFDSIEELKKNALPGSPEDFDFFLTAGDNVYPADAKKPTQEEFQKMMGLFLERENIKDLPIYPVRGNHDCYYDTEHEYIEIELQKQFPTWKFNDFYYQSLFQVGPNGEKMSILHVDSCYLLCSSMSKSPLGGKFHKNLLDDHTKRLYEEKCENFNQTYIAKGHKMMSEFKELLNYQQNDTDIIWKSSITHYMMFGLNYDDYNTIIDDFLPLMKEFDYDIYFNGHEHQLNYAYTAASELGSKQAIPWDKMWSGRNEQCQDNMEIFPQNGTEKETRHFTTEHTAGRVNQFTIGGSGQDMYQICPSHVQTSKGKFVYGQNKVNGYALVNVNEKQMEIKIKGIVVEEMAEEASEASENFTTSAMKSLKNAAKSLFQSLETKVDDSAKTSQKTVDLFTITINKKGAE